MGSGLWRFEGDDVKSARQIRPLRPTLQEQLGRPYYASLLTGIDRARGAVIEPVTPRSDLYEHELRTVQSDNVYLAGLAAKITLQHAQSLFFY